MSLSCGGSGAGSRSPNTPSRANTKPARVRRNTWERAEITDRAGLQPPARMQSHPPAGQDAMAHAAESRTRNHVGKCLRLREAPDRFDQIAIGFRVSRHRAAQRRNDIERIEVVEQVEARHVDG